MAWSNEYLRYVCYGFLYLAVLCLWLPKSFNIRAWSIALFIATVAGLYSHQLNWLGLAGILLFATITYLFYRPKQNPSHRALLGMVLLLFAMALFLHIFPGFFNLKVINSVYLSPDAIPLTLYLNFDKAIVGIFILGFGHQLITRGQQWQQIIKPLLFNIAIIVPLLILLSYRLGYVRFEPKLPNSIFLFSITNLLFICVSEEALFRGFLQNHLAKLLSHYKGNNYIAILLTAVFHGLAHYPGGSKFVLLATVASISYGWVYYSTKRIEASILTHFSLNMTHYLFFTYPALASAF